MLKTEMSDDPVPVGVDLQSTFIYFG